jgi:uridylate kinase
MVSGGLKVGWSTDMGAAVFADVLSLDRVYKISNIDYVYDKDPKEYFDAKPIKDMTWKEYFKLFDIVAGEQHTPNHRTPLDVESVQFCSRKGLSFFITGGATLEEEENISKILQTGTFIHP